MEPETIRRRAGQQLQNPDQSIQAGQDLTIPTNILQQEQKPLALSPAPELTPASFLQETAQRERAAAAEVARAEQERQATRATEEALMRELGTEAQFRAQERKRTGALEAEQALTMARAKLMKERNFDAPARLIKAEQDVIGTGVTTSFLSTRLSNRERDNAIRDLLATGDVMLAQGAVDSANAVVEEAVKAKYEPIKAELDIVDKNLTYLDEAVQRGDLKLSREEEKAFALKKDEVEQQRNDIEKVEQLSGEVIKNGAPANIQRQALEAKNLRELLAIPGIQPYLMSQEERLSIAIKSQQLNRLQTEISGQIEETNPAMVQAAKDKIDLLGNILSNKRGLGVTTGPTFLSRGFLASPITLGGAFGSKDKFVGDISKFLAKDTLDKLVDIKAQGATFGALSDSERQAIANAANSIAANVIRDPDTDRIKKIDMSQKDLIANLEEIKRTAELSYLRQGGALTEDMLTYEDMAKDLGSFDLDGNFVVSEDYSSKSNAEFYGVGY